MINFFWKIYYVKVALGFSCLPLNTTFSLTDLHWHGCPDKPGDYSHVHGMIYKSYNYCLECVRHVVAEGTGISCTSRPWHHNLWGND